MTHPPSLHPEHISPNAKLYAHRSDLLTAMKSRIPPNPEICEVGVALGDFSQFMIDALRPRSLVAIDIFTLHKETVLWGKPTKDIFGAKTHREFYQRRFPAAHVLEGLSAECLSTLKDKSLDLIYVDAGHSYEDVKGDIVQSVKKIKPDGVIVFNDYTMYDHLQLGHYGVVRAVNELVTSSDWKVIGFALNPDMFCDIAVQRV